MDTSAGSDSSRKRAEEAQRRTDAELVEAQRLARVGSWQWYPETDTVIWSEELYRIAGLDPNLPAVSYKEHPKLFTAESWECLRPAVEAALRAGTPYELDVEMVRADGTKRWLIARGEAQRDTTGRIVQLRGTVQDITERKQAEEARFWHAVIVESSDDAIISKDLEGVILTWNRGAQRLFGFTESEAVGRSLTMIVPEELYEEENEILRRVKNGEHIEHYETIRVTKEGRRLNVSLTISPVRDWTGKTVGSCKIARDITQSKLAEASLRESEERFRLVANTAPVMIWMSDLDKLCTYFNHPWLEFTGRSIQAELGNGWAEGVHSEDLEMCLQTYTKAFDQRESFQMEYRLRRHDGEYRWILDLGVPRWNADGSFAGYIGSCIDVTERKHAEEARKIAADALRESESLTGSILESLRSSVAVVDNEGTILGVNRCWLDFAAANSNSQIAKVTAGVNYLDVCRRAVPNEETEQALGGIQSVLNGSRQMFEMDYSCDSPSERRWFHMTVAVLLRNRGGAVISHLDITKQMLSELEQRRMKEETAQMNRAREVGQLAASLTHELAQPLAAVLSNAQAAARLATTSEPNLPEIREALADIIKDDKRACAVLDNVRAILKKHTIRPHRVNLNGIVEDVALIVRSDALLNGVQFRAMLSSDAVPVQGDEIPLQQVLLNLVNNSMAAMREIPREQRTLTIKTRIQNGFGLLLVEDEGPGIPDSLKAKLFLPFFTTKTEGLGMGLSICSTILESLGGSISFANLPGRGAAFSVQLRLAQ